MRTRILVRCVPRRALHRGASRRVPRRHQRQGLEPRHAGGSVPHHPACRRSSRKPGDVITVHEGIYRERINPPRGGESDAKRIVYQAAPGEKVEIKGSEVVKNWVKVQDDVWKRDPARCVLRRLQSLQRSHSRRLVQRQGPAASHRRRLSERRVADRGGQAGRCPEAGERRRRSGSARSTRRTPRSGRSSRGSTRTSNWSRSTCAGRCSIPTSRAGTTSPCAASRCATRPRPGRRPRPSRSA